MYLQFTNAITRYSRITRTWDILDYDYKTIKQEKTNRWSSEWLGGISIASFDNNWNKQ